TETLAVVRWPTCCWAFRSPPGFQLSLVCTTASMCLLCLCRTTGKLRRALHSISDCGTTTFLLQQKKTIANPISTMPPEPLWSLTRDQRERTCKAWLTPIKTECLGLATCRHVGRFLSLVASLQLPTLPVPTTIHSRSRRRSARRTACTS